MSISSRKSTRSAYGARLVKITPAAWILITIVLGYVGWSLVEYGGFQGAEAGVSERRIFVSDSGDDKNSGSIVSPKRTIRSALDNVNSSKGLYTAVAVMGDMYHLTSNDLSKTLELDVPATQPVLIYGYQPEDVVSAGGVVRKTILYQGPEVAGESFHFTAKKGSLALKNFELQTTNGLFINVLDGGKASVADNDFTCRISIICPSYSLTLQHFQRGSSYVQNNRFWMTNKTIDAISSHQAVGLRMIEGSGAKGFSQVLGNQFYFPLLDQIQEQLSLSNLQVFPNIGIMASGQNEISLSGNQFMIDRAKYPTGQGGPKSARNVGILMPGTLNSHVENNTFIDFYGTPVMVGAVTSGTHYLGLSNNKK